MSPNDFFMVRFFKETPGPTLFVLLLMAAVFLYTFLQKFTPKYVRSAPTIFTTAGILGTFVGISVALFRFNPSDLQRSLPEFLSGMKTAFYISLMGVGASLLIKLRYAIWEIPAAHRSQSPDPGSELIRHQLTLHGLLSGGESEEAKKPLSQLLVEMKQENREGLRGIQETLSHYLSQMAENNSRALVDALESVMESFQERINESTSSSMKDLAKAVKEIVLWQESYREAMPVITKELLEVAGSMQEIGASQKAFADQATIFRQFFEKQGELLLKMDSERGRVENALSAFMKVMASMEKTLPVLDSSLREFVTSTANGVKSQTEAILSQMEKASEAMTQNIDKNRVDFERALQRELTLSITGLGQQLASLSEKFVEDYTPLTERLQSVLRMAEQPQAGR